MRKEWFSRFPSDPPSRPRSKRPSQQSRLCLVDQATLIEEADPFPDLRARPRPARPAGPTAPEDQEDQEDQEDPEGHQQGNRYHRRPQERRRPVNPADPVGEAPAAHLQILLQNWGRGPC